MNDLLRRAVQSGRRIDICMEMDDPRSRLARFVEEQVLRPLGVTRDTACVADLVRCWFSSTPRMLAAAHAKRIEDVLRPAARNCAAPRGRDREVWSPRCRDSGAARV